MFCFQNLKKKRKWFFGHSSTLSSDVFERRKSTGSDPKDQESKHQKHFKRITYRIIVGKQVKWTFIIEIALRPLLFYAEQRYFHFFTVFNFVELRIQYY